MLQTVITFFLSVSVLVALPFLLIGFFTSLKERKKIKTKQDQLLKFLNRVDQDGNWDKIEGGYFRRG